jgi:biopolymer transport protein ExbD
MKPLATMNVIPFIDIMLVLLAIVLTTATFVAQGKIPVNLPSAEQAGPLPTAATVEIAIDAGGEIYLDGEAVRPDALAGRFAGMAGDTPILLRVDGRTAFEHFVEVVDRLKAHELTNLSIVTKRTTD